MEGKRDVLAECKAKLETTLKVLTTTTISWKAKDTILFAILRRLDIASCSRRLPSTSLLCLLLTESPSRWYSFSNSFLFSFFYLFFPLLLFVFFISSFSFLLQGVTTFFWVNLLCYLKAKTNLYTIHIEISKL